MWFKAMLGTSAALLSVGVAAAYWLKSGPQPEVPEAPMASAAPLACTLNADQLATRREELASFWRQARETCELDNGYAFRFGFDPATLEEAARVIAGEAGCCSFLDFRLTAQASKDLLLLEVTGPAGAKELLAASLKPESASQQQDAPTTACCSAGVCTTECAPVADAKEAK